MKKSLIAMAALAATTAFAQSSVTLYGIVEVGADIGYNRTQDTTTTVNTFNAAGNGLTTATTSVNASQKNSMRVQDGNSQGTGTSRVGFRGTEDLGGGMKANFLLEMGIRVDDGAITNGSGNIASSGASGGNAFGRNAWGGLSGGFGEVRLGRQVLGSFGVQSNSGSSGASNGLYDASTATLSAMGGVRFSNAIRYLSPDMSGFKASVMIAAPETNGDDSVFAATSTTSTSATGVVSSTNASRRTGFDLALEYANGPAYVGFGYNKRDSNNVTSSATPAALGTTVTSASPGIVTGYTLGGAYDLGVIKPFINYTRQKTDISGATTFTAVIPANSTFASITGDVTARAWSIGLRAPVGAFTVIAGFGRVATTTNGLVSMTAAGVTTLGAANLEEKRNAFQLGAQYALSKRTSLQANYGYNRLSGNGNTVTTSTAVGAGRIETPVRNSDRISALNFGLKHSF